MWVQNRSISHLSDAVYAAQILKAMNEAVSRLYVQEDTAEVEAA